MPISVHPAPCLISHSWIITPQADTTRRRTVKSANFRLTHYPKEGVMEIHFRRTTTRTRSGAEQINFSILKSGVEVWRQWAGSDRKEKARQVTLPGLGRR